MARRIARLAERYPVDSGPPDGMKGRTDSMTGGEEGMERAVRDEMDHATLAAQVRALGVVPGSVLLVHTAFRAVRPVAGGPLGLVAALRAALGPDGTLAMPSWTGNDEAPFDPATTPCAADLGATADLFWRQPGVRRSPHLQAFAAIGPRAEAIVETPLPLPPHVPDSPVGRIHDLDGQVLLLGVGHDADTSLHLAELMAGVPYGIPRQCTVFRDGGKVRLAYRENDHCCDRFALADGWLRDAGLQREGRVGHAAARLFRARDVVRLAVAALRDQPTLFLHPRGTGCAECDEAWASIPA